MEDSSKLEYQAGQEEEEGGGKDKDKRKPEPQQQQQQEADKDRQGGEGEEEGGVNEDVEDKYEESHFAPPTAPEQVILVHTLKEATVIMARANHDKIGGEGEVARHDQDSVAPLLSVVLSLCICFVSSGMCLACVSKC